MSNPEALKVMRVMYGISITVPPELRTTVLRLMQESVQITVSSAASGELEILISEDIRERHIPN